MVSAIDAARYIIALDPQLKYFNETLKLRNGSKASYETPKRLRRRKPITYHLYRQQPSLHLR